MKTRKKTKKPVKKGSPNRGGRRPGAGRKAYSEGNALKATICIRCTKEQKEALMNFAEELGVSGSTWLRDLGLKESNNEDLIINPT